MWVMWVMYSPYDERSRFHWVLNFCWNSDTCAWATFLLFSCRSNCTYLLFSIVFKFLFSWINGYVVVCSEFVVALFYGDYCCHLWRCRRQSLDYVFSFSKNVVLTVALLWVTSSFSKHNVLLLFDLYWSVWHLSALWPLWHMSSM